MDWNSLGRFHVSIATELILFIFLAPALALGLPVNPTLAEFIKNHSPGNVSPY